MTVFNATVPMTQEGVYYLAFLYELMNPDKDANDEALREENVALAEPDARLRYGRGRSLVDETHHLIRDPALRPESMINLQIEHQIIKDPFAGIDINYKEE